MKTDYDHAMDLPEVARRTGALLVGSEATAQIGRGRGALNYRVGQPPAVEVRHPRGVLLVQGSAGFVPRGLSGINVDVLFMGVGDLGTQSAQYSEACWTETVDATSPSRLIPVHWDSLFAPIEGPFTGELRAASFLAADGGLTLEFLKQKEAGNPQLTFQTLPRYEPVVLY